MLCVLGTAHIFKMGGAGGYVNQTSRTSAFDLAVRVSGSTMLTFAFVAALVLGFSIRDDSTAVEVGALFLGADHLTTLQSAT
jgi:hypothetical protein